MINKTGHITTSELAKQSGVNLQTIRYYGRSGLLPKSPRSGSGYRLLSHDSVRRVRFIKQTDDYQAIPVSGLQSRNGGDGINDAPALSRPMLGLEWVQEW